MLLFSLLFALLLSPPPPHPVPVDPTAASIHAITSVLVNATTPQTACKQAMKTLSTDDQRAACAGSILGVCARITRYEYMREQLAPEVSTSL